MMRVFPLILMVASALLLVGCGDYTMSENRDADGKLYNGAKNIDDAAGVFWRIEASYRVKETGERLDFNYVVSAFNRDVVGSYSGVFFPKVVFKKTKNNAVLAVDAPIYYHAYGFHRLPRAGVKDAIPRITWYPNADDKRFAESYVTSDAYHSPRAAVEFIDYKITQVTREDSKEWWANHLKIRDEAEYFIQPENCDEARNVKFFSFACRSIDATLSPVEVHIRRSNRMAPAEPIDSAAIISWDTEALQDYKKFRKSNKRYVCQGDKGEPLLDYRELSTVKQGEKERRRELQKISQRLFKTRREQRGSIYYTGAKRSKSVALGLSSEIEILTYWNGHRKEKRFTSFPVTQFYPVVRHKHPNPGTEEAEMLRPKNLMQVVTSSEWRGFALPIFLPITDLTDEFPTPDYKGDAFSVLYLDDELVCESPHVQTRFSVYDFKLGRTIEVGSEL